MPDSRLLESGGLRATETSTVFRALESYAPAGVVYSDDFNRADSSAGGMGASWYDPTPAYLISSNHATKISGDHWCKFTQDLGTPDHWVEADITISGGAPPFIILNARGEPTSFANAYMAFQNDANQAVIGKQVSGSYSTVASSSLTLALVSTYRLEVEGSAQRFYRDDILVASASDTSVTTGNYVGLNCFTNAPDLTYYDNFRCGPLPYTP